MKTFIDTEETRVQAYPIQFQNHLKPTLKFISVISLDKEHNDYNTHIEIWGTDLDDSTDAINYLCSRGWFVITDGEPSDTSVDILKHYEPSFLSNESISHTVLLPPGKPIERDGYTFLTHEVQ